MRCTVGLFIIFSVSLGYISFSLNSNHGICTMLLPLPFYLTEQLGKLPFTMLTHASAYCWPLRAREDSIREGLVKRTFVRANWRQWKFLMTTDSLRHNYFFFVSCPIDSESHHTRTHTHAHTDWSYTFLATQFSLRLFCRRNCRNKQLDRE